MSFQRHSKRPRRSKEEDSEFLWDETPPLSPEADALDQAESSAETLPSRSAERPGSSQSLGQTDSIGTQLATLNRKFNILAKRQLWVMGMLRRLVSRQRTQELAQTGASTSSNQQSFQMPANPVSQPITSRAGFRQLNARLLDSSFRKELESYLQCLGGRNTDDFVKRIFYSIFDDAIALELNFQGRKGKEALGGSKVYEVITGLYIKWNGGAQISLYDLEAAFIRRLKRSLDAAGKRVQRHPNELPFYEDQAAIATSSPILPEDKTPTP